jgi:hypothetical protein
VRPPKTKGKRQLGFEGWFCVLADSDAEANDGPGGEGIVTNLKPEAGLPIYGCLTRTSESKRDWDHLPLSGHWMDLHYC